MTIELIIDSFKGDYDFLSNFFLATIRWEDEWYPSNEHAFQAGKTEHPDERRWVAAAPTPGAAKRRGRRVTLRPGWDEEIRYHVMYDVLWTKFTTHLDLGKRLLDTGSATLVEGNYWHDNVWGDCRCGRATCARTGDNYLGRSLMRLRATLCLMPALAREE